jgi:hypothetical protein
MPRLILILLLFLAGAPLSHAGKRMASYPSKADRVASFDALVHEMKRLDGDGLLARKNRPEPWPQTVGRIRKEVEKAPDFFAWGRALRRFDAAYPNLHASAALAPELDESHSHGRIRLPLRFNPIRVTAEASEAKFKLLIGRNDDPRFRSGDELIDINGRPLKDWLEENFIFCKFPLRPQCDREFYRNFAAELLGWHRGMPLEVGVIRAGKLIHRTVEPQRVLGDEGPNRPRTEGGDLSDWAQRISLCGRSRDIYQGFELAFEGQNLCAFESKERPNLVVLRIASFAYPHPSLFVNVDGEVKNFWLNYWRRRAPLTTRLVLDLSDNGGGNWHVPYAQLFLDTPFETPSVKFKTIHELSHPGLRELIFDHSAQREHWFRSLRTIEEPYLPATPMFCPSAAEPCGSGSFNPLSHGFHGSVWMILNHHCISSCVAFARTLRRTLGTKLTLIGLPDSADTAFKRARIGISRTARRSGRISVHFGTTSTEALLQDAWVVQSVSISQSTDPQGGIISAVPLTLDHEVPLDWDDAIEEDWQKKAWQTTLGLIDLVK